MPSEHAPELAADLPSFLADKTPSSAALTIVSSGPEAPARKRECPPICGLGQRSGAVHGGAQPTDRRLQLVAEAAGVQTGWAQTQAELPDGAVKPVLRRCYARDLVNRLSRERGVGRPNAAADQSAEQPGELSRDRKSTRLNSSHRTISYAVFCLKKKKKISSSIFTVE